MRIAYCTNVRLPNERAHGHQVARVCDALASLGHKVTIFCPYRKNVISEDFWTYEHARKDVELRYIGTFDPIASIFLPGVTGLLMLNAQLRLGLPKELNAGGFDLLYTRTPALLPTLIASGKPVVLELHKLPKRSRHLFVRQCNQCRLVACLTSYMASALREWGVSPNRITVAPDAVNLAQFTPVISTVDARSALRLPQDVPMIGYAGQLASMGLSKGIPELFAAIAHMHAQGSNAELVIAGGPESVFKNLFSQLPEDVQPYVRYLGTLQPEDVPRFLFACDVLVYPSPPPATSFHLLETSPLKVFEYMASGKPMVTADLPPLRDILTEDITTFCTPGDPRSLAHGITWVLEHPAEAATKAAAAHALVQGHSWEARMQRVLDAARL